jgi:hypothetical protein
MSFSSAITFSKSIYNKMVSSFYTNEFSNLIKAVSSKKEKNLEERTTMLQNISGNDELTGQNLYLLSMVSNFS